MNSNQAIKKRIDEALESLLSDLYKEQGIESGDIAPEQLHEWEMLTDKMGKLFSNLIDQNKD